MQCMVVQRLQVQRARRFSGPTQQVTQLGVADRNSNDKDSTKATAQGPFRTATNTGLAIQIKRERVVLGRCCRSDALRGDWALQAKGAV